jgi:hypothetical protein
MFFYYARATTGLGSIINSDKSCAEELLCDRRAFTLTKLDGRENFRRLVEDIII